MKKRLVLIAGVIATVFCACASQNDRMHSSEKNFSNSLEDTEKASFDSQKEVILVGSAQDWPM